MRQRLRLNASRNIGFSEIVSARALNVAGTSFALFFHQPVGKASQDLAQRNGGTAHHDRLHTLPKNTKRHDCRVRCLAATGVNGSAVSVCNGPRIIIRSGALLHQRAPGDCNNALRQSSGALRPSRTRKSEADSPRASTSGSQSQISQYLGPDGDHRDEQRQRGERGGFLD